MLVAALQRVDVAETPADVARVSKAAFGPDDWPVAHSSDDYQDFLSFSRCDDCGLTGEGMLFGKGGRPPTGFDWYYLFDQGKRKHGRPMMLTVSASRNFTMKGITLLDAPCFNVAINGVTGAEISHVNITSTWYTVGAPSCSPTAAFGLGTMRSSNDE